MDRAPALSAFSCTIFTTKTSATANPPNAAPSPALPHNPRSQHCVSHHKLRRSFYGIAFLPIHPLLSNPLKASSAGVQAQRPREKNGEKGKSKRKEKENQELVIRLGVTQVPFRGLQPLENGRGRRQMDKPLTSYDVKRGGPERGFLGLAVCGNGAGWSGRRVGLAVQVISYDVKRCLLWLPAGGRCGWFVRIKTVAGYSNLSLETSLTTCATGLKMRCSLIISPVPADAAAADQRLSSRPA